MTSNFRTNNNDLYNIYKRTNPIPLPLNHYLINSGNELDNQFSLYKHGVRKRSYFLEDGVDTGSLFQVDAESFSIELGPYNMGPWGSSTKYQYAKWIWNISNAQATAPGSGDSVYLWFYYSFYSTVANSGTIYGICDDVGTMYLNNVNVGNTGSWGATSDGASYPINILKGLNYIRVAAYNADTANPAGLIIAVYDSNNTNIANTNSNWVYSQVSNSTYQTEANFNNMAGALTFNANAT